VIGLILAAWLTAQPSLVLPVPQATGAVLLDGRCDDAEWRSASRIPLAADSELLLQQDGSAVFICVPLPPESYGTMDLYVASAATPTPVNLHASAQVGERQRSASGWPEWTFGNQRDWYSPPVALSRAEVVGNRSHLTFGVVSAREVAIRKSKFGAGPWRMMIEIRALGAAKKGMLRYPASGSADDPASWATIGVGPVSIGPVGPTIISIDSRALGERREVWVDAPPTSKGRSQSAPG
jgi:hypothetical protein